MPSRNPPMFMDDEVLSGSERKRRYRDESFPVMLGEIVTRADPADPSRRVFPFKSWAMSAHFSYPAEAEGFLGDCQSAAEAFFVRSFVQRPGVQYDKGCAVHGDTWLALQRRVGTFYLDAAIGYRGVKLGVEIDGHEFHGTTWQQVQADYRRQRALVLRGFYVIRFTARDAMSDPDGCWVEIDHILDRLARGSR